MRHEYKNYFIEYDPPPIPVRSMDWQFWSDSYNSGLEHSFDLGSNDPKCGSAASLEDAKEKIDELIKEYSEWHD